MGSTMLGISAAALVIGAGVRWLHLARRVRLPRDATPYVVANGLGVAGGVVALAAGAGIAGAVAGALAALGGAAFLALFAASGQRAAPPAVSVGGRIIDVVAPADDGRVFDLASLRGHAFLLKFFRGHWCPYCVAELRRWEDLRPELDALGVRIVTVCADTAAQIRAGRAKHGLHAVMLPDPALAIVDRYGLRNPRNFAPKPGLIIPLPIPTTILVDADGIVRWIDQAADYMRRSDPARVLAAVHGLLPAAGSPGEAAGMAVRAGGAHAGASGR